METTKKESKPVDYLKKKYETHDSVSNKTAICVARLLTVFRLLRVF